MISFTVTDKLTGAYLGIVAAKDTTEALQIFVNNTIYQEDEIAINEFTFEPIN